MPAFYTASVKRPQKLDYVSRRNGVAGYVQTFAG